MANQQSRVEEILFDTINGISYDGAPESRVEELLLELKEVIEAGGGGGGGTSTIAWKPTVAADGTISWTRTASETKPDDQNIKGPAGTNGTNGTDGEDGEDGVGITSVNFKETDSHGNNVYTITLSDLTTYDIVCPKGPQGESGASVIDDTSTTDTDKVWSAKKTYDELMAKANSADLGTAAAKNFTTSITSGSGDLPTAGAVNDAIDAAVTSVYKPGGSKTCAELTSSLLIAANEGKVYNVSDTGVTTSDFIEGAGKEIGVGSDVGVIEVSGGVYKFNLMPGIADQSSLNNLIYEYYIRNGMKNLAIVNQDSSVMNTIRFTNNGDGTFSVDGTNSKSSSAYCFPMIIDPGHFKPGKYTISGVPAGAENVSLTLRYNSGSGNTSVVSVNGTTPSASFTLTQAQIEAATLNFNLMIGVPGNATADNVTVSPMIVYEEVGAMDNSFKKASKTNEELTAAIGTLTDSQWAQIQSILT